MDWSTVFVSLMAGWLAVAFLIGFTLGIAGELKRKLWGEDLWGLLACLPSALGAGAGILLVIAADRLRVLVRWIRPSPLVVVTVLAIAALIVTPAFAGDGSVTIPWGAWLSQLLIEVGVPLAAAGVVWAFRRLPAGIRDWADRLTGDRVEQLLERAIGWGINAVAGAAHYETLSIEVGNQVAREALEYATRHAPQLVERLGAPAMLEKILARLRFEEAAEVQPQAAPAL